MAYKPPTCPLVELGLICQLLGFRRTPWRSCQIAKILRQVRREELTVYEESVTREGPAPPLVGDRLEGLGDASLRQRMRSGLGLAKRVPRIPHHVFDPLAAMLGENEAVHHRTEIPQGKWTPNGSPR